MQELDQAEQWGTLQSRRIHNPGLMSDQRAETMPNESLSTERELFNSFRERQQLLHIFFTQVDPILRILHRPSLQAHLLGGKCYLNYAPWHPAPAALTSAVFYAASCALSPEICLACFGMDKASLISKHQSNTNYALQRADYLLTNDLTVLQAFVISLVSRDHEDSGRFVY